VDDPKTKELEAHVVSCSVCSVANKRVNDFCETGQLLFFVWAEEHPPRAAALVELTPEQYEQLVQAVLRRARNAERN